MNSAEAAVGLPVIRPPTLSQELERLRQEFMERPAILADVITALGARAFALLMIVCALPFLPPVSLPGSSTPLGLIVAVIAFQLALGRLPWLPRRVLRWQLPAGFFTRVVPVAQHFVRRLEKVLHPRWPQLTTGWLRPLHLFVLCAAGLLLALPMPIPLTNTFPGWTILLLACGLLERDGIFIVFGHLAFWSTIVFFALLGSAITEALQHSWHWIFG